MLESQGLLNKFKTHSKKQRERDEGCYHHEDRVQVGCMSLSSLSVCPCLSLSHLHSLLPVWSQGPELRVSEGTQQTEGIWSQHVLTLSKRWRDK